MRALALHLWALLVLNLATIRGVFGALASALPLGGLIVPDEPEEAAALAGRLVRIADGTLTERTLTPCSPLMTMPSGAC